MNFGLFFIYIFFFLREQCIDLDEKKLWYLGSWYVSVQFDADPNENLLFFNSAIENMISSALLCCPGGKLLQIYMDIALCDVVRHYVDA